MRKIIGIHIIPITDTGLRHRAAANCKCLPSKDTTANPKVPVYTHNTVGVGKDTFKIKIESSARTETQ